MEKDGVENAWQVFQYKRFCWGRCVSGTFDDIFDVCRVGEDVENVLWWSSWLHAGQVTLNGSRLGHGDVRPSGQIEYDALLK